MSLVATVGSLEPSLSTNVIVVASLPTAATDPEDVGVPGYYCYRFRRHWLSAAVSHHLQFSSCSLSDLSLSGRSYRY